MYTTEYSIVSLMSLLFFIMELPCIYVFIYQHKMEKGKKGTKTVTGKVNHRTIHLPLRISIACIICSILIMLHSTSPLVLPLFTTLQPNLSIIEFTMLWTINIDAALIFYFFHEYCFSMWKAFVPPGINIFTQTFVGPFLFLFYLGLFVIVVVDCGLITYYNTTSYGGFSELVLATASITYLLFFLYFERRILYRLQRDSEDNKDRIRFHRIFCGTITLLAISVSTVQIPNGLLNMLQPQPYLQGIIPPPILIWAHIGSLFAASIFTKRNALIELQIIKEETASRNGRTDGSNNGSSAAVRRDTVAGGSTKNSIYKLSNNKTSYSNKSTGSFSVYNDSDGGSKKTIIGEGTNIYNIKGGNLNPSSQSMSGSRADEVITEEEEDDTTDLKTTRIDKDTDTYRNTSTSMDNMKINPLFKLNVSQHKTTL